MKNKHDFQIDFIGIGAPKCGTTWLSECLREHPEIDFSKYKEPHYFLDDPPSRLVRDLKMCDTFADYVRMFDHRDTGKKKGEFSTHYLYDPEAPRLIKQSFPKAKLIVCLRNPVDMAYSWYTYRKATYDTEFMPDSFEQAVTEKDYLARGFYFRFLDNFYQAFGRDRILVVLYDHILADPSRVVRQVYGHIGVDTAFRPSCLDKRIRQTMSLRSAKVASLAGRAVRALGKAGVDTRFMPDWLIDIYSFVNKKPAVRHRMPGRTKRELKSIYIKDVNQLEALIQMDLSGWK